MDRYREGVNLRIDDLIHTPPDPPSLRGTLAPGRKTSASLPSSNSFFAPPLEVGVNQEFMHPG